MEFLEEHLILRNTVRDRMRKPDIQEMIKKYELHGAPFAWEFVSSMAELGLTGINIPEEYDGAGMDNLSGVIAMIEMSRVWSGGALILAVGNSLVSYPVAKFGTESQKRQWLPDLAAGKILGSFGLTEPGHGSDAGHINETYAEEKYTCWLVSGQKHFITNIPAAKFIVLFARTKRQLKDSQGITAFLVPILTKGNDSIIKIPEPNHKLGNHAAQMGTIFFEHYPVLPFEMLGKQERGFGVAMSTLAHGRNWIAAQAIGVMEHALELALAQTENRVTFEKPLNKRSSICEAITRLKAAIDISKVLLFYSVKLEDEGKAFYPHASLAKLFSSEAARALVQEVQKMHGGTGYVMESPITPLVADSVVFDIYEGASNVQRSVIADAWIDGKIPVRVPPFYQQEFKDFKARVKSHLKGKGALELEDQQLPFQAADILPWWVAKDLIRDEFKVWPKEFMNFQDPSLLLSHIYRQIKRDWNQINAI